MIGSSKFLCSCFGFCTKPSYCAKLAEMAVNKETRERLSAFMLQEGDVVMARRGDLGRCALVTKSQAGWLCGTGSLILRFTDQIFQKYIVMLLGSDGSRNNLMGSSVGSTMSNLNQRILLNMPTALPPLAEQKHIVAKVDELMALLDELETGLQTAQVDAERLLEAVLSSLLSAEPKQPVEA